MTEGYTYDAVGNRLTSAGPISYNYNASNELTSTSTARYTYDNNGNTPSKTDTTGTTYYTWDYENRLTSVTLPGTGGTVNFKYDPFGRRIEKVAPTSGTTIYAYDGDNVVEELGGGGNVLADYTQGAGIDEPLALTRSRRDLLLSRRRLGLDHLADGQLRPTRRQLCLRFLRQSHGFDRNSDESVPVHRSRIRFGDRPILLPRQISTIHNPEGSRPKTQSGSLAASTSIRT